MRKFLLLIISLIGVVVLSACGNKSSGSETAKLKVSAASVPHAEVLELIQDDLKDEGVELEILIVSDGVQTNTQTAEGQLDANFFQHTPYLNQVNEDSGLDLVSVVGVHVEPFGVYSKTIDDINDFPEGGKFSLPKDPVNFSRALELLAENNIIELDDAKTTDFLLQDITKNDKNIDFVPVDAEVLVHSLDDVAASAINVNYALEGGFKPLEDSLIIEGSASNYVNILVSREDNKDDKAIQILADWLTSDKVKEFIEEEYEGAVIPVF